MKLGLNGAIATLLHAGDYFVVTAGTGGPSFEYSPDAPAGAPVTGAAAAYKGRMVYFDTLSAADLLATYGTRTEEHLLGLLAGPKKALEKHPVRLAVERWARLAEPGTQWNGNYQTFHSEVLMVAGLDLPYGTEVKRGITLLPKQLAGVKTYKLSGSSHPMVQVEWDLVIAALPEPDPV